MQSVLLLILFLSVIMQLLGKRRHTVRTLQLGPMKAYHLLKPEKRGIFDIHLEDLDFYVDRGMLPNMQKRDIQKVRLNLNNLQNQSSDNAYNTALDIKRFFLRGWGQYEEAMKPEKPKEKRHFLQLHDSESIGRVLRAVEESEKQTSSPSSQFSDLLQPADTTTVKSLFPGVFDDLVCD